jgi:glycosyltransferase 2 family protein
MELAAVESAPVKRKAKFLLAAKVLFSVVLLALVLAKVDPGSILQVLVKANIWLIVAWYALVPVVVWLSAWRWEVLAPSLPFSTALKYTWIGVFYAHVLPGAISGDIAKGVSLAFKDNAARTGLAASIVAEKVIGLTALLLFFDLACAVVYVLYGEAFSEVRRLAVIALILSIIGIVTAVVVFGAAMRFRRNAGERSRSPVGRAVYSVATAVKVYSDKPMILLQAFGLSVAIHIVNIFALYLSLRALHVDAGIPFASVVYPVISVMVLMPISISGIGVRDVTLVILFTLFGLPPASGVAMSWLALFATVPNIIIGGTIQLLEIYKKRKLASGD